MNENTKEWPFFIPFSVKCRALILAHLDRLSIPKDTLENGKQSSVEIQTNKMVGVPVLSIYMQSRFGI